MKNYLTILTIALLFMTSCNEESTTVDDSVDAVKNNTSEAIQKTTNTVNDKATEQIENIKREATTPEVVVDATTMKIDRLVHDFGTITDEKSVSTTFTITNTGNKPLIITQAKGSCGCTVPQYPKTPIAPGESGKMDVSFDPKGKAGAQNKTVTIIANTEPASTIINVKSVINKTTPVETK